MPDIGQIDYRSASSAEDHAIANLEFSRASELLDLLTADQREVLALRVVVGFSVEETSEIAGKTISSVKQLQRRALHVLRNKLQERV